MTDTQDTRQKILFLDVDGPLIDASMYIVEKSPSHNRIFNPISLRIVKRLVTEANAKIVMNTYHNTYVRDNEFTIKDDLISAGIEAELFHENWKTEYPKARGRLSAINDWQEENGEANWVAFDDEDFNHERLALVDFRYGLSTTQYNHAATYWGIKKVFVL